MEASKKGGNWKEGKQLFQTVASFGEKNNKRESDNGNVPLAPFSLCFLLLPPPPHHHHSLSFSIVHTLPSPTSLLFLLFQANGTSRDLKRPRDTVSACQSASANPSGEKKCAKCSDHRKLFLSGCFADLRSVMCVSAAASICDCCCCNDDVYFEAAAAATLQSA